MPVVRVSDDTFSRLKDLAEPLVDSVDMVIKRLLGIYHHHYLSTPSSSGIEKFDPEQPPDLRFSTILETTVFDHSDGNWKSASNWNQLNRLVIKIVYNNYLDACRDDDDRFSMAFDEINQPNTNIRRGYFNLDGYHYIPDIDVSIQNVEANRAWKTIYNLVRDYSIPIKIKVLLRTGQEGILAYDPNL